MENRVAPAANPANHEESWWRVIVINIIYFYQPILKIAKIWLPNFDWSSNTVFPITSQIKFKFLNVNRNVFRTHLLLLALGILFVWIVSEVAINQFISKPWRDTTITGLQPLTINVSMSKDTSWASKVYYLKIEKKSI